MCLPPNLTSLPTDTQTTRETSETCQRNLGADQSRQTLWARCPSNSKRTLIPGSVTEMRTRTEIRAVFQSEGIITAQIGPLILHEGTQQNNICRGE